MFRGWLLRECVDFDLIFVFAWFIGALVLWYSGTLAFVFLIHLFHFGGFLVYLCVIGTD